MTIIVIYSITLNGNRDTHGGTVSTDPKTHREWCIKMDTNNVGGVAHENQSDQIFSIYVTN